MTRETEARKRKTRPQAAKTGAAAIPAGTGTACSRCGAENLLGSRFCHQCAASLGTQAPGPSSAKTIKAQTSGITRGDVFAGRYEVIEELGSGGMGKVFKVFDRTIGETVALKMIRPEIGAQDKAIERFKNELKFTRKITHRNICRMYDLGEEGINHYITMEYVAGEDLKSFVRRAGALNSGKAVFIAKQVCEGLAEAHRVGAVHRDLKPQNIMIDRDGNAKVMDFGIARFMELDRMTGSGIMIGTPEYMSPEQVELLEVDRRADIYSLGIVLFEMLTGKVPFEGGTPLSLAMKHKLETPANVRDLNAQISVGLADVVAKCLEKDREKRYQSAEELLAALDAAEREIATGERVVAKKTVPPSDKDKDNDKEKDKNTTPPPRKAGGNKAVLVGAAGLAVLALVIAGVLVLRPSKGEPQGAGEETLQSVGTEVSVPEKKAEEPRPEGKKTIPPQGSPQTQPQGQRPAPSVAKPAQPVNAPQGGPAVEPPRPESPASYDAATDSSAVGLAKARTAGPKANGIKMGLDKTSVYFRLASAREAEAESCLARKKTTDARCLFSVAERLYRLSLDQNTDEEKLKTLKRYAADLNDDADRDAKEGDAKVLLTQGQAAAKLAEASKELEGAAKNYAQAAFLFEKARWISGLAKKK